MVHLNPSSGSKFAEETKKKYKQQKSSKKGITSSFTPGFLKLNTSNNSPRENVLNCYRHVLDVCGFHQGATSTRRPYTWKVSCDPSRCYQVQLCLTNDLEVVKIEERPLNWVHGTIVSGGEQIFKGEVLCTCDARLQISSSELVKEGSLLFREVLPEVNGSRVIPIAVKEGKPVISTYFAKRAKQVVTSVRHVKKTEMFTNGSIDASVVLGEMYYGQNLVLSRPFCELSLYFNGEKLSRCIKEYLDEELLHEVVTELYQTSVKFQQVLEENLPRY